MKLVARINGQFDFIWVPFEESWCPTRGSLQDSEVFGKQASPASGSAPALGDSSFWMVYFLLANIRGARGEVKRKARWEPEANEAQEERWRRSGRTEML